MWFVDLLWIDDSGTASDWDCTDYGGGYCECYRVTTSSDTPPDPVFDCDCEE
jgi:hypothetical protein